MKTLQKITLFIALVALFASCQSNTDVNKNLSNHVKSITEHMPALLEDAENMKVEALDKINDRLSLTEQVT